MFRIREVSVWIRIPNPYHWITDPALFFSGFQETNKDFFAYCRYIYQSSKMTSHEEVIKVWKSRFFKFFLLLHVKIKKLRIRRDPRDFLDLKAVTCTLQHMHKKAQINSSPNLKSRPHHSQSLLLLTHGRPVRSDGRSVYSDGRRVRSDGHSVLSRGSSVCSDGADLRRGQRQKAVPGRQLNSCQGAVLLLLQDHVVRCRCSDRSAPSAGDDSAAVPASRGESAY
jgi:hypothetical protein